MPAALDLTGYRFGKLVVVERAENRNGRTMWLCQCDCGNVSICATRDLRKGDTKSCGCFMIESRRNNAKTHGQSGTKLHKIWASMRRRCRNSKQKDYKWYGGRGIRVCNEWENDFVAFRDWALSHGYKDGLTIDRIDSDGDYCPENCRWATMKEQQNNRRSNRVFSYNGESHNIREWSDITGINYHTLYMRLRNGWEFSRAIGAA